MLNLFIAFVCDSYNNTIRKKTSAYIYQLANMISVYDKTLSDEEKKKLDDELKDKYLYIAKHKEADLIKVDT